MLEWQEVGGDNLNKCMDDLVSYGENVESCIPRVPKKLDTATEPYSIQAAKAIKTEGGANIFCSLVGYASFHNNNNWGSMCVDEISNVFMEIWVFSTSTILDEEGGLTTDEHVGLVRCNT